MALYNTHATLFNPQYHAERTERANACAAQRSTSERAERVREAVNKKKNAFNHTRTDPHKVGGGRGIKGTPLFSRKYIFFRNSPVQFTQTILITKKRHIL